MDVLMDVFLGVSDCLLVMDMYLGVVMYVCVFECW